MNDERRGLISEDHSEITLVDDDRREVWFRKARPEYWCGDCGRWHRAWSAIGEKHDPRKASAK